MYIHHPCDLYKWLNHPEIITRWTVTETHILSILDSVPCQPTTNPGFLIKKMSHQHEVPSLDLPSDNETCS